MFKRLKLSDSFIVIALSVLFIIIHLAAFYYKGFQYLMLLPFVLVVAFIVFTRIDKFFILTIFSIPLSIPLFEFKPELSYSITLPSELFIVTILFIFILKLFREKQFSYDVFLHPVSIAIYFNLLWLIITSATSTMPIVSFKFVLSRIWFLTSFYFLATMLFDSGIKFTKYIWAYVLALVIVIFYAISRHVSIGLFDSNASHYVMNPFYRDHTSYGAVLALTLPVLIGMLFTKGQTRIQKFGLLIVIPIVTIGLILSYSRAAWLGVIISFGVLILVILRIRFWIVFLTGTFIISMVILNWTEINYRMQSNTTDSSASLEEHVQSVTNISNDYSNVERLNRWNSAIGMFKEKPILGWGPATYMFQYAPFQSSQLKNPISTDAGDRGNAHSEYLGPLAESGVLGTVTFLIIIIASLVTGFRVFRKSESFSERALVISVILGLITYIVHGILNNFLDTAKVSSLFWGYIAFFVMLDIRQKKAVGANSEK